MTALVGIVLVALAHILETHFVTCTVWWWWWWWQWLSSNNECNYAILSIFDLFQSVRSFVRLLVIGINNRHLIE